MPFNPKSRVGHFAKYQAWLEKQPLSEHSKRAYRSQLNDFLGCLGSSDEDYRNPFKDETERDYILKDYKRFLRQKHKASPNTVNAALAAADYFYQFLGLPKTKVKGEDLPAEAPRALTKNEQKNSSGPPNVPGEQKIAPSSPFSSIREFVYQSVPPLNAIGKWVVDNYEYALVSKVPVTRTFQERDLRPFVDAV